MQQRMPLGPSNDPSFRETSGHNYHLNSNGNVDSNTVHRGYGDTAPVKRGRRRSTSTGALRCVRDTCGAQSAARSCLLTLFVMAYLYMSGLLYISTASLPRSLETEVKSLQELFNRRGAELNAMQFPAFMGGGRAAPTNGGTKPGSIGAIPIVLYVYERPHYFRQVLDALRNVDGIGETVLVISHDSLREDMLALPGAAIDFMRVKQLLHPKIPHAKAAADALKKHWWWLVSHVFEELFPGYDGDVVFIEEDHVVSPDFYRTLQLLSSIKNSGIVDDVATICLGSYETNTTHASLADIIFYPGFMNTAYAFNRTLYNHIVKAQEMFDQQGDDDWDCSLAELQKEKLIPSRQISPRISRVRNVGAEGMHKTQDLAQKFDQGLYRVSEARHADIRWQEGLSVVERDTSLELCRGIEPCSARGWNPPASFGVVAKRL